MQRGYLALPSTLLDMHLHILKNTHRHTLVHTDVHTYKTHTHTFSRTVSAEGLGERGGVGDVVG